MPPRPFDLIIKTLVFDGILLLLLVGACSSPVAVAGLPLPPVVSFIVSSTSLLVGSEMLPELVLFLL